MVLLYVVIIPTVPGGRKNGKPMNEKLLFQFIHYGI